MADKILVRRGNQSDIPALDEGEPGFTTDTRRLYVGSSAGNILINTTATGILDGYVPITGSGGNSTIDAYGDFQVHGGTINLLERSVSPGDVTGYGKLFVKNDNVLYFRDDLGVETNLISGGGSGTVVGSDLDGYVVGSDLDGYITAAQGADGYVAFFTSSGAIAGDNDFFWNRAATKLKINGAIYSDASVGLSLEPGDGYVTVIGNLETNGQAYSLMPGTATPTGTTQTIDWDDGNTQELSLASATGDVSLTLINGRAGASYILKIIQDESVARDIVWPAEVRWPGGITPAISAGANAVDIVSLLYDGYDYFANIGQNFL